MLRNNHLIIFRSLLFPKCTDNVRNDLTEYISWRGLHRAGAGQAQKIAGSRPPGNNAVGKASRTKHTDNKNLDEMSKKNKDAKIDAKEGAMKKIAMKEWTEQTPAWLARDHDESELVKHIEVLQRFSARYNAAYGNVAPENSPDQTASTSPKEEGKKKMLKMIDKQHSKNYGTYVTALANRKQLMASAPTIKNERRSLNPIENRSALTSPQETRTFLTLANETPLALVPRRKLSTSLKKKPPIMVKDVLNPDAIQMENTTRSTFERREKPKLYTLVNPNLRNKDFEAYMKKTFTSTKMSKDTAPHDTTTVGEYFNGRYSPEKISYPSSKKKENLTKGLKESLVEGRRTTRTSAVQKDSTLHPNIHARTTLNVQTTHLPLQKCKNMRLNSGKQEAPGPSSKQDKPAPQKKPSPAAPPKPGTVEVKSSVDGSLLNRLMKYFKK